MRMYDNRFYNRIIYKLLAKNGKIKIRRSTLIHIPCTI